MREQTVTACATSACPHWSVNSADCSLEAPGPSSPPQGPNAGLRAGSLVLASLEVGRVLADRGRTTFRAQGTCMYPTVRPGDVLHIESRAADEVAVGDIGVCRRPGFLFSHRVIDKGVRDGRPYIVTRPDRSRYGDDGPTYDEDVLGVVTVIERKGRRLPTSPQRYPGPARLYLTVRLGLIEALPAVRGWLIVALVSIQRGALYQWIGRLWLSLSCTRPSYIVQLPLRAGQTHDLYHPVPLDKFDVTQATWQGRPPDCWTLALRLNGNHQPAAWATFVLCPPECPHAGWQVSDLQVRARYRGLGFEADLMDKAEEIFAYGDAALQRRQV